MRFMVTSIIAVSFVSGFVGCSSSSDTPPTPIEAGAQIVSTNSCKSCHGGDLAGSATGVPSYPSLNAPNITPDQKSGIGGWTDAQLTSAIRKGVDDQGQALCWVMPRFPQMSDTEVANVIAYLRSLPAVDKDIPDSDCPAESDGGKADASK